MKRILYTLIALALVLALGLAPLTMAAEETDPCEPLMVVDLIAGQDMVVGTVTVENDAENLCVTYALNEEALAEGYLIYETHLFVSATDEFAMTRANKKLGAPYYSNPVPGLYPYGDEFEEGVPEWTFCISLEELGVEFCNWVYVSAHAVVGIQGELEGIDLGDGGIVYYGSDTQTKGDWKGIYADVSSPIGRYGSCAYILPNPPRVRVEEVVGEFSVPVGFDIGDPSTYSLLSQSPWNWTSSQILGLDFYEPDPPYHDEFWTAAGMEDFTYSLSGTHMGIDSRSLVALEPDDSLSTRAACWFAGSGSAPTDMDITLQNLPTGQHMLSLYLVDWDSTARQETVTVQVSTESEAEAVTSFYDGIYLNFFLNLPTDDDVNITVVKNDGANAVVSGVFLSTTTETALDLDAYEVRFLASDVDTLGNWLGTYGNQGWILAAYDAPGTKTAYWVWNAAYDRSEMLNYSVSASQYAWTALGAYVDHVQYPVFEWSWGSATEARWSDPRAAYYPEMSKWLAAVWDDGGERCNPEHGYFDFNLHFPEGRYMLSLYTYDWERVRSSQEYQIFDAADMNTVLASSVVDGSDFDEGVFAIFVLEADKGGRDMVVRVYNDAGHPVPNINVLLQGVFVDCLQGSTYDTAWGDGNRFNEQGNWGMWFEYHVCDPCDEWIVYGSNLGTAANPLGFADTSSDAIFAIDLKNKTVSVAYDPGELRSSMNYPNGNAYDPINQWLFFATDNGQLYFYDMVEDAQYGPFSVGGQIASGAWYNGDYYYVPQGSATIYKVVVDKTGALRYQAGTLGRALNYGDIVFDINRPGVLFGSGGGDTGYYFTYDLNTGTYDELRTGVPHKQLAFASNGVLYGVTALTGDWYEIDPVTGDDTLFWEASTWNGFAIQLTDLADGPMCG